MPLPIIFGRRCLGYAVGQRRSSYVWLSGGFPGLNYIQSQVAQGMRWQQTFSKTTVAGGGLNAKIWWDMWPCTGDPAGGGYTGAAFTLRQFDDTVTGSILHGGNVAPLQAALNYFAINGSVGNSVLVLYDRVATYEACTYNANVQQNMTNTLAAQRYVSTGQPGLQISIAAQTANGATPVNLTQLAYTNQAGTTGVALPAATPVIPFIISGITAAGAGAEIICPNDAGNGQTLLFLNLAPGDTGVRKIESFTTDAAQTGTFTYILNRPLAYLLQPTPGVQFETDLLYQVFGIERVFDGACLSFFAWGGTTSASVVFTGRVDTVWG